jgi:hypothetical protein
MDRSSFADEDGREGGGLERQKQALTTPKERQFCAK